MRWMGAKQKQLLILCGDGYVSHLRNDVTLVIITGLVADCRQA